MFRCIALWIFDTILPDLAFLFSDVGQWFSPDTFASYADKTGRHSIANSVESGIKHNWYINHTADVEYEVYTRAYVYVLKCSVMSVYTDLVHNL